MKYLKNNALGKIRLAMVGGGIGSMIGDVHRYAARLDNCYELVAGVFSTALSKSQQLGAELGMNAERIYPNIDSMINEELKLPQDKRIEVVAVVTPNHLHFDNAQLVLNAGLHLIIDKPLTITLAQAQALHQLQKNSKQLCCVTYTYCGYPMVKEARYLLQNNCLGKIKKIIIDYPQGWLSENHDRNNKQAAWRQNPHYGIAGTLADIGTHAFHLAEYVSGLQVSAVNAQLNTLVPKRLLDDDVSLLLKFHSGAVGVITATQIAAGEDSNLKVDVYAEHGSLFWEQDNANQLVIKWRQKPTEIKRGGRDNRYLSDFALAHCRTPAGHPEGYIEAFANHYRNFAYAVRAHDDDEQSDAKQSAKFHLEHYDYPHIADGVRGVAFIEAVIKSAQAQQTKWETIIC